jgi:hypothetical protein
MILSGMMNDPLKVAVCFYGLGYGLGRKCIPIHSFSGYSSIQKMIYRHHNCDTFVHAWVDTKETQNQILKITKPDEYIMEKQIEFDSDANLNDPNLYKIGSSVTRSKKNKTLRHATLSQTHTRTKSLELAFSSMQQYDFIVLLRNDLFFIHELKLETLKKDILYVPNNPKSPKNASDFFFVGSPDVMKHLLGVEDHLCNEIFDGTWTGAPEPMLERYYSLHSNLNVCRLTGDLDYRKGFWLCRERRK